MTKAQYLVISLGLTLFLVLYLGFDRKPANQKVVERSREIQGESTGFETILADGKSHLDAGQSAKAAELEQQIETAPTDKERIPLLKKLSGLWYGFENIPVAGGFAEQAATLEQTDTAWSVTGATFYQGLLATQEATMRSYCAEHAVKAFENAASLNPGRVEHRVNLALVYAENPPPNNPMQAVLMLRDLESKHPENAAVYNALGRLAIKTGQWARAIERLEKSWSLDKNNPNTPCLLAKAYEGAGNLIKSNEFADLCQAR